jgi:ribosome biogenesis protein NSA1
MRAVTGDETGLVKVVTLVGGAPPRRFGEQKADAGVVALAWGGPEADREAAVWVARKRGALELWELGAGQRRREFRAEGVPCGLGVFPGGAALASCSTGGVLQLWTLAPGDAENESEEADAAAMAGRPLAEFRLCTSGTDIARMRVDPLNAGRVALVGKEQLLRVFDTEKKVAVFKARNVRHDMLDMRVPVWGKDVRFFPRDSAQLAEVTAYRQLRIYDVRAQTRPVVNAVVSELAGLVSAAVDPEERLVAFGDGAGGAGLFDLRTRKVAGSLRGFGGSVRCLEFHTSLPLLASCSIDRFFRVFALPSRKLAHRFYLKQRLSALLFSSQLPPHAAASAGEGAAAAAAEAGGAAGDDALWAQLDTRAAQSGAKRAQPEAARGEADAAAPKRPRKTAAQSKQPAPAPAPEPEPTAPRARTRSRSSKRSVAAEEADEVEPRPAAAPARSARPTRSRAKQAEQ